MYMYLHTGIKSKGYLYIQMIYNDIHCIFLSAQRKFDFGTIKCSVALMYS